MKIIKIHSPEFKNLSNLRELDQKKSYNKQIDWKICRLHTLFESDYFITKDRSGFIGKNNEKIKKFKDELGIKVRFFDKNFIKELKEVAGD